MADKSNLEYLRQQARQRHRAATRKVSRLKNMAGVDVSGTSADPRRDLSKLKRYNESQLKSYMQSLNSFTSRRTQYVPDAERRPIPAQEWKRYKDLENKVRTKAESQFDKLGDLKLPTGETLRHRRAVMTPDHATAGNVSVNSLFEVPDRSSENIPSRKKLRDLTRRLANREKRSFYDKQRKLAKQSLGKMVNFIGDKELGSKIDKLTNDQFNILWNATNFATRVSLNYHIGQRMLSDKETPWYSQVAKSELAEAEKLVDWAGKINVSK